MADHNENDASTYAKLAGFDSDWRDGWWNQDFLELTARRTELSAARRILDVGCGAGHWGLRLLPLAAPDATLVGIDREAAFLERANQRAADRGMSDRTTYQAGHGETLPFDDESFDLVTCQTVLMHVADARAVLLEMVRVLRPGGLLLASEPDNLASAVALMNGETQLSIDDTLALTRMRLVCGKGKIALGHGDENIGGRLPGLMGALGLSVQCWTNDRASTLVPPYEGHVQATDIRFMEDSLQNMGAERALEERRWVAGGGAAEDFALHWDVLVRERRRRLSAIRRKQYHGGRGFVHYLVAGRAS